MLKDINYMRLLLLMFLFLIFATLGYFVSFAYEEGNFDDSGMAVVFVITAFRWLFILVAFPVWFVFKTSFFSSALYFGIILFDCLLYGLLIEIGLTAFKRHKARKKSATVNG